MAVRPLRLSKADIDAHTRLITSIFTFRGRFATLAGVLAVLDSRRFDILAAHLALMSADEFQGDQGARLAEAGSDVGRAGPLSHAALRSAQGHQRAPIHGARQ
jgi:hypothetical protein